MLPMRDDKRTTTTEDRATQPMEAGGWVSQFLLFHHLRSFNVAMVTIGFKCLSIEAGREGSWRKNRNQTQALKGSEGAESEARNTARSQILQRRSVLCHCCVWNNPLLGYTKPATMLHKASRWARLPPISTAGLHMITSNWTRHQKWHMTLQIENCGVLLSEFSITDQNQKI